jgi:alpha-1,3-glucosyltransferase
MQQEPQAVQQQQIPHNQQANSIVVCSPVFALVLTLHSSVFMSGIVLRQSLPCRYYEATSEWTLDYPPLFAWFEYAMAQAARYCDPKMLVISNLDYESTATVLFQRLSVSITGLVLVAAMLHATKHSKDGPGGLTAFFLAVCNAGLIMVDNIHFQYNGILLGELHLE